MGYIGNTPAEKYITLSKQTFTPDSSTVAFTLDNPVANENELAVFVNNVRQEPGSGKAYTATGNTLTMSEAPTSGHAMYAIYLGKTMATNTPADGSVTNAMLAGSIANSKLANSSITVNGSAVSLGGSVSIDRAPYWSARETSLQTISHNTETKATLQTEILDSSSAYDVSNSRFTVPSGQAGDYFVWFQVDLYDADSDITNLTGSIKKNGSTIVSKVYTDFSNGSVPSHAHMYISTMLSLSESDYIENYILMTTTDASSAQSYGGEFGTQCGGFKLS